MNDQRNQQITLLKSAGSALYNAARSGMLSNGRPLELNLPTGITGPRAGALEIYAGLDTPDLVRALAAQNNALAAQFVPWQFAQCQVYMSGRCIRIEAPWPDDLANRDVHIAQLNRRPTRAGQCAIGMTEVGSTAIMQIDDSRPHVLIAGTTGSGKTTATITMLMQLSRYSDQFILIDGKGGQSLRGLDHLPGVIGPLAVSFDETRAALAYAVAEMLRRQAQPATNWPRLYVVIEEIATFSDDAAIVAMVKQIAGQGRESHVHLIMTTQRPTAATLGDPAIKLNTPSRLAMHVPDASSSIIVTGRSDIRADYLGDRGDCYAISPIGVARLQVGFYTQHEIDAALTGQPLLTDWPDYDPAVPDSADRAIDDRAVAISLIHAAKSASAPRPLGRPALIKMFDEAQARHPGTDGLRRLMASTKSILAELNRQGYTIAPLTD